MIEVDLNPPQDSRAVAPEATGAGHTRRESSAQAPVSLVSEKPLKRAVFFPPEMIDPSRGRGRYG